MTTQNTLIYYPVITDIVKVEDLPEFLSFIKEGIQSVFSKLYYKDYYFSKNISGNEAFYSLSVVSKTKIAFNVPGTEIYFVLNPDFEDGDISSFPITLYWHWEVIRILKNFNASQFSFSVQDFFDLGLQVFNISESDALQIATSSFVAPDPGISNFQQLIADINLLYGSNITIDDYEDNKYELLITKVNALNQAVLPTIFALYIFSSNNVSEGKQKINLFFSAFISGSFEDFVKDLILPKIRATLSLSAAIEFPPSILKPVNEDGSEIPDKKTKFQFAQADFYADTENGFGYQLELGGTLMPTYAAVGNTGLILQIESLKVDLSKNSNIAEADAYGYPADFVGVYARAISVTFPPKWFHNDNDESSSSTTTLRLGGYDLLVGTGGVSGTIMLESVPVIGPGTTFEYYKDKFTFDYPIFIYDIDLLSEDEEIIEVEINDYDELKDMLQYLSASSNAPYPFKFPLSITPIGEVDSIVFEDAPNYQYYLARLNNNLLWKRLGGENGFQIGFSSFDITLNKNSVVSSNIAGGLKIAKFTYPPGTIVNGVDIGGQPVQIDVKGHLDGNGDFLLTASSNPPFPIQFENCFILHLKSVELGKDGNDFFIGASADIEFLDTFGELLEGQTISISTLRIYSDGHIDFKIDGGSLTLPKPIKFKLGPVNLSVTAIHFGSHERVKDGKLRRYNYFGFDGGINIGVAGIDARGDGIKYYYTIDNDEDNPDPLLNKQPDNYLHIQTIHIDMIIPASSDDPSVAINGWLTIPEPGEFQEYQGGVDLKIKKPRINGKVDMRLAPKYPAFLIDAAIELPNPIPLGPVSIYGFRGLLGYRYVAEKEAIGMNENNTWYQYYTAPERGVNVKKFSRPDQTEQYGFPFSLGVGAIIGDTAAAGTIISANAMLLLSLPSMVMVDARMKLLSTRVSFNDDPPFFAFFIFGDNSLEFGFGADYKYPDPTGEIIKLYAEIQAGFFFNNPSAWYINFGTKEQPISAKLLMDLFTLKSYLMISGKGIEAGARGEFRFERKYGPVKIFVLAYLELGGRISFQNAQMGAYFEAGLAIDINFKIFRLFIAVTILLAVEAPKPFLIYGAFVLELRFKLGPIKFKFKFNVELKWEFNSEVDKTAVNPFTQISEQATGLVKGISMLTNETFDLLTYTPDKDFIQNPALIDKVIPLDSYIDIKTTKGLLPGDSTKFVIGGYNNPADLYVDLIPPQKIMKGLELRQVKHQYSLDSIKVFAYHESGGWVEYNPFKALNPTDTETDFSKMMVGQWQKKDNQYNAIRLLATTPFSFTEQGNPGWFIPEQYGVTPSTLFCTGQLITSSVSDFLNQELNSFYYASSSNYFHSKGASYQLEGDVYYTVNPDGSVTMSGASAIVSDEANSFGFAKSLEFPNDSPLTIMLPAPSLKIELKLSTYSSGVTVTLYAASPDSTPSNSIYLPIEEYYRSKDSLSASIVFDTQDYTKAVTKIVIHPDLSKNVKEINRITEQMAVLVNKGYQLALEDGGNLVNVVASDPQLYDDLILQLNELQAAGCEGVTLDDYPIACTIYPDLLGYYNNNFNQMYAYRNNLEPVDESPAELYAFFIRQNIFSYYNVLTILNNSNINNPVFTFNKGLYTSDLNSLNTFALAHPDDYPGIIERFETLKSKYKQIVDWLKMVRSCADQVLCDLGSYLSYQDFGIFLDRPAISESPLLEAYYDFVSRNIDYSYLNDIVLRQINYIQSIVNGGWMMHIDNVSNYNLACQELISIICDLGNCIENKKCVTLFHEVSWLTVEDYHYNVNVPGSEAIQSDYQASVDGITKFIQPIWRPDTRYYVKLVFKDEISFAQSITSQLFEYKYGFRTAGPLGFFHLDSQSTYGDLPIENSLNILEDTVGIVRDPEGNEVRRETPHPDLYPHTSLRSYIDYERSYPNADGNLVSAKPLFYDDELTTEIRLYFNTTYASKMMDSWGELVLENKVFPALGGTFKIIIKDPLEGTSIVNPPRLDNEIDETVEIPQTTEDWNEDDHPQLPAVYDQYFNMLLNSICTGEIGIIKPKSYYRNIKPSKLKPQKLYTVQVLNFYWGTQQVNLTQIDDAFKQRYVQEVHKFVFQTSRYKDFLAQIYSFYIDYEDQQGESQQKQAIYTLEKAIAGDKLQAALDTIKGNSNLLSDSLAMQYQHKFDRVFEGLFGISPLEDSVTTEFNKIIDLNTGRIVALLIRNPEPFNHPKIPLELLSRIDTSPGMIEVVNVRIGSHTTLNTSYHFLYSKDYSKAIVMNDAKWIVDSKLNFQFVYKAWDGLVYSEIDTIVINNVQIN